MDRVFATESRRLRRTIARSRMRLDRHAVRWTHGSWWALLAPSRSTHPLAGIVWGIRLLTLLTGHRRTGTPSDLAWLTSGDSGLHGALRKIARQLKHLARHSRRQQPSDESEPGNA